MDELVLLAVEDGVATITLNRPEVGNALNSPLLRQLKSILQDLAVDETVAVVIVTGAGRMFCTGEDLRGLANPDEEPEQLRLSLEVFELLRELPQPTIAAVNGYALTGGLELILGCDLRIASPTAMFGDTHARVGITPGGGDSQRLPRLVGLARAKEMLFTCAFVTAEQAVQFGLANHVVPAETLIKEARAIADKIKANDGKIIRRLKKLVNEGWERDLSSGLLLEQIEFQKCRLSNWSQGGSKLDGIKDRNRALANKYEDR